jgi:hypothetical protein
MRARSGASVEEGILRAMRTWPLFASMIVACGAAQHPTDAGPRATHAAPPPLPSARALDATATFGDLVMAAVHQDDRRASDSDAGCLVRTEPTGGYTLEADLSVAVRGITEAPTDVRARVEAHRGSVRVLTRLGSYGGASPLVFVALTTLAGTAQRTGVVLVVTAAGVHVLRTGEASDPRALDVQHAIDSLTSMDVASVFVSASASVPLADVAALLRALPASLEGRVALATLLPEGATLPEDGGADDAAPLCADGLPPLADDAIGEADAASLHTSLSALVPAAQACVATSASGLGGLVHVAFRIAPDGHVHEACVIDDATGDATLRACLVAALEAITFAAPTGGSVDVELPLRLELEHDAAHHQRAICD